jgi:hypothetical protein
LTNLVVGGALASKPGNGGEAWVRLSYVLGFRQLGIEVRFLEQADRPSKEAVEYFQDVTRRFDIDATLLDEHERVVVGPPVEPAGLLVDISGNVRSKAVRKSFRRTAFVDIDPGFTQFWHERRLDRLQSYDVYFTIAQNLGGRGGSIPASGLEWRITRPPALLELWPRAGGDFDRFTTVASWRSPFGPIEPYGLKHHEWRRFSRLPALTKLPFEAAIRFHPADDADRNMLEAQGWRLVDPQVAATPEGFRDYVRGSGAEFSVAQGIYVETKSGWLSDRSVRYLASGRPALVQDTGLDGRIPTGEGLLTFRTLDEAAAGARAIAEDYPRHASAARAVAEEHFDSDKVLTALLEEAL